MRGRHALVCAGVCEVLSGPVPMINRAAYWTSYQPYDEHSTVLIVHQF